MQKLKVKQIDGVVSPAVSDDWSTLTDQLATAASTSEKINNAVSDAMGGALQSITGGSAESGKYVSAVTKEGTAVKVSKTALPVTGVNTSNTAGTGTTTKAVVSLALSNGKVVAYAWADAMSEEGYTVTISYDRETGIYTCEAIR